MKYLKTFENLKDANSFTIEQVIDYFHEKSGYHDVTKTFLQNCILNKKISIHGEYNDYENIIVDEINYSPKSSPVFWFYSSSIIGVKNDDIITLEYDVSDVLSNILNNIIISYNSKKI